MVPTLTTASTISRESKEFEVHLFLVAKNHDGQSEVPESASGHKL
jgi:hypothetical protein